MLTVRHRFGDFFFEALDMTVSQLQSWMPLLETKTKPNKNCFLIHEKDQESPSWVYFHLRYRKSYFKLLDQSEQKNLGQN